MAITAYRVSRRRLVAGVAAASILRPVRVLAAPVPTPDILHSRGLGITLAEWKALHGKPTNPPAQNAAIYEMGAAGLPYEVVLYASKDTNQIHDIDINFDEQPTANAAALIIASLLPTDSVQTGQLVPDPQTIVGEYHSDWLATTQRDQDGFPLWPNAQPGDYIVIFNGGANGLRAINISLGNDTTLYGHGRSNRA